MNMTKNIFIRIVCVMAVFQGVFSLEASATLKLMSFNVRYNTPKDTGVLNWDVRKYAIQKFIHEVKPDVVGVNEARKPMRDDLRELLPDYDMIEIAGTGSGKGANAVIIYNRNTVKLLHNDWFFHSATPKEPSECWDVTTKQWRGTVWGLFKEKATGRKFYYFCTHLCLGLKPCDLEGKLNSSLLNLDMMQKAAGDKGTVFLGGDMNASYLEDDVRRWGLQPYYYWMKDARLTAPETDNAITFNAFGKMQVTERHLLDYIFYRNADITRFETFNEPLWGVPYISDHYPVMVTVEL